MSKRTSACATCVQANVADQASDFRAFRQVRCTAAAIAFDADDASTGLLGVICSTVASGWVIVGEGRRTFEDAEASNSAKAASALRICCQTSADPIVDKRRSCAVALRSVAHRLLSLKSTSSRPLSYATPSSLKSRSAGTQTAATTGKASISAPTARCGSGSKSVVIEGATRLSDSTDEAMLVGLRHCCACLTDLRRLLPDTEWRVAVEDDIIQWDAVWRA